MITFEGNNIKSVYLGESKIKYIYLGSDLIYTDIIDANWIKLGNILDTGLTVNQDTKVIGRLYNPSTTSKFFWRADSTETEGTHFTYWAGSQNAYCRFDGKLITFSHTSYNNVWITSEQNKNGFFVNNTQKGTYTDYDSFTSISSFKIYNECRFKYVQVYNNDELVADFRAIKQLSTGYFGLVDVVSGNIYVDSSNTGNMG